MGPGDRRCRSGPVGAAQDAVVLHPRAKSAVAAPLLDLLLAQDSDPRVPVLALIDARLATGETDGWHYDDMPEDGQAWRDTLAGLDSDARGRYGAGYAELTAPRQARLLQDVQDLAEAGQEWHDWSAGHVWSLWTRYACTAFYSHPWAWNEIGFSGPGLPARLPQPAGSTPANTSRSPTTTTSTRSRSPPAWSAPAAPTTTCPNGIPDA